MTLINIQELFETLSLHTYDNIQEIEKLEVKLYLQRNDEDRVAVLKDESKRVIGRITDMEDPTFKIIFEDIAVNEHETSFFFDDTSSRLVTIYLEYVAQYVTSRTDISGKINEINSMDENIKRSPFIGYEVSPLSRILHELLKLPHMKDTLAMYKTLRHLESIYENMRSIESGGPIKFRSSSSKTRDIIEQHMGLLGNKGWIYAFHDKEDYNTYCKLLTKYFEGMEYKLPALIN